MSTDTDERVVELERRVMDFLTRNFQQIQMHGGDANVEEIDLDTGEVSIRLGGACSGCGISPMTTQAIQSRMPDAIPEVETVHVETGEAEEEEDEGMVPSFAGDTIDTGDESPF